MKSLARWAALAALCACAAACLQNLSEADTSDPAIKSRLESRLRAQKGLDLRAITIDVHSGIVTVSGLVNSYEERSTITKIANDIPGVEQAVVNVIVQDAQ